MTLTEKGVVVVFLYWLDVRNASPWGVEFDRYR
jgi:hypothetical protein